MSTSPVNSFCRIVFSAAIIVCLSIFGLQIQAQTKSKASSSKEKDKKTALTKNEEDKKSAAAKTKKEDDKKSAVAKKDKEKSKTEKTADKGNRTNKVVKPSKAELAKKAEQQRREEEQRRREEEQRRREAEKQAERQAEIRRAEEARRQAILEEKRRREQAAREARARAIAFERGLKTETQENIAADNTEGEDPEVRRAAVTALGNHAGTVVVMEPQTGKVLSIVNQDWGIRKGFKPCSTIKLVTGVAGVNEKVIGESGNITTRNFRMNLDDALAHSNNTYFQVVGANLGSAKMIGYARALGLGEKTGINAEGETSGRLPYGNNNARIYSHGDDFEVTPLQLAVAVSAISNGGKVVVPQIPRSKVEKTNFRGMMRREVNIPQQSIRQVIPGMIGAVTYGTARRSGSADMGAAGKTGSCIGQGSWLGLFASVAPIVNPQLAVVVVTRGQGERGKYASAIAGQIYRSLSHRYGTDKPLVAKVPLTLKPQNKITAQTSAKLDNDEGEDSDEGDAPKPIVTTDSQQRPNPKKGGDDVVVVGQKPAKTIEKTVISKPSNVFDPIVIQVNREKSRPRVVVQ